MTAVLPAACLVAGAAALLGGCAQVERTTETTSACTAALEALDELEHGDSGRRPLEEFLEQAINAENPELAAAAVEARAADGEGRVSDVRRALQRARAVCEQQGGM